MHRFQTELARDCAREHVLQKTSTSLYAAYAAGWRDIEERWDWRATTSNAEYLLQPPVIPTLRVSLKSRIKAHLAPSGV